HAALAAATQAWSSPGKAGGNVDRAARDGSADRAADVRWWEEIRRRLQPGRWPPLWSEPRLALRHHWRRGPADLAIHSGGRPGGRLDERTAPRLHRAGHGPPRHSEQRVDLTLLSDLLLQPEQTAGTELRHECRRDAAPPRPGPGSQWRGRLPVRSPRCRRDGPAASLAPAAGTRRESYSASWRLVTALGLRAQPWDDRHARCLVDAGHRGLRRLDDFRRPADGGEAVDAVREFAHRHEPDQEHRRWGRQLQRRLPQRDVRLAAALPHGLCRHPGHRLVRR